MIQDKRTPGERLIAAAEEALRFARGEKTGAKIVEFPDIPAIRERLGLSQNEFAARFGISLGTLRNWEQGVRLPDGPARALLKVIEREPAAVQRALALPIAKSSKPSSPRVPTRKSVKPKRKRA